MQRDFSGSFARLLCYLPAGQSSMCTSTPPVDRRKRRTRAKFLAKKNIILLGQDKSLAFETKLRAENSVERKIEEIRQARRFSVALSGLFVLGNDSIPRVALRLPWAIICSPFRADVESLTNSLPVLRPDLHRDYGGWMRATKYKSQG